MQIPTKRNAEPDEARQPSCVVLEISNQTMGRYDDQREFSGNNNNETVPHRLPPVAQCVADRDSDTQTDNTHHYTRTHNLIGDLLTLRYVYVHVVRRDAAMMNQRVFGSKRCLHVYMYELRWHLLLGV